MEYLTFITSRSVASWRHHKLGPGFIAERSEQQNVCYYYILHVAKAYPIPKYARDILAVPGTFSHVMESAVEDFKGSRLKENQSGTRWPPDEFV